jgi:hypothetical protein
LLRSRKQLTKSWEKARGLKDIGFRIQKVHTQGRRSSKIHKLGRIYSIWIVMSFRVKVKIISTL